MSDEIFKTFRKPFKIDCLRVVGSESNVSIMTRLCWKYQLNPVSFYNKYLNGGSPVGWSFFNFEIASHFNSYTNKTMELETKFGQVVTGRRNVFHSYSFLSSVLDPQARGFIATSKRWCGQCYRDRLVSPSGRKGNGIFDDLYWSVNYIQICMLHGCCLTSKCPHCYRHQPYLSPKVEPGYCYECHGFLGSARTKSVEHEELARQQQQFHLFYLATFEELIPNMDRFLGNLSALKSEFPTGMSEYLGKAIGCSEDVVRKWISGARKPQIESLFRLQGALELSGVHQLFLPEAAFMARVALSPELSFNFHSRSKYKDIAKEPGIKLFLDQIIVGKSEPLTRKEICQKFEVTEGYLTYRFKNECELISQMHENLKTKLKEQRDNDVDVIFDRAFSMVKSRKKETTLKNVINEVPQDKLVILQEFSTGELVMHFYRAEQRFKERKRKKRRKFSEP